MGRVTRWGPAPEQQTRREHAGTVSYSEYHPLLAALFLGGQRGYCIIRSGKCKGLFPGLFTGQPHNILLSFLAISHKNNKKPPTQSHRFRSAVLSVSSLSLIPAEQTLGKTRQVLSTLVAEKTGIQVTQTHPVQVVRVLEQAGQFQGMGILLWPK